jgi:hypothetical protein
MGEQKHRAGKKKKEKTLPADQMHGDPAVVVVLDEREKIRPHRLKHHADVRAVGADLLEVVPQPHDLRRTTYY